MSNVAPRLYALSEAQPFSVELAEEAGIELGAIEERRFDGGEFKLRPLESVRGRTAFVFQSLAGSDASPVCDRLVRLLFLIQGLRDAGAEHIVALVPYLAFARKDRRTQPRDPVTSRYIAELLEAAGTERLVALDVHNPAALDNAFRIPVDHLSALPLLTDHFVRALPDTPLVAVSPDVGGIKRVQKFQEQLERKTGQSIGIAFLEKRRERDVVTGGLFAGDVAGKAALVLDDLCATGGTLIRAAEACRHADAAQVHVAVTHVPLPPALDAVARCEAISSIVVTDSVALPLRAPEGSKLARKLRVLPVRHLLGQAVRRMISGAPLAPLLEQWPIPPEA